MYGGIIPQIDCWGGSSPCQASGNMSLSLKLKSYILWYKNDKNMAHAAQFILVSLGTLKCSALFITVCTTAYFT